MFFLHETRKKKLTRLRSLLSQGKIDRMLWAFHFPDFPDKDIPTCKNCEDYKINVCGGGRDPIECFIEKTKNKKKLKNGSCPSCDQELREVVWVGPGPCPMPDEDINEEGGCLGDDEGWENTGESEGEFKGKYSLPEGWEYADESEGK